MNIIIELNNSLESFNSWLNEQKKKISELEGRLLKIIESKKTKEQRKVKIKQKHSKRLVGHCHEVNIHIIGIQGGEERK